MCGWDTDCNAGNVGTIAGVLCGLEGIPARYRDPINDAIVLSGLPGSLNILDIPTYARVLASIGYRLAGEKVPESIASALAAGDGERAIHFDFALPGSTHGMRVSDPVGFAAVHRELAGPTGSVRARPRVPLRAAPSRGERQALLQALLPAGGLRRRALQPDLRADGPARPAGEDPLQHGAVGGRAHRGRGLRPRHVHRQGHPGHLADLPRAGTGVRARVRHPARGRLAGRRGRPRRDGVLGRRAARLGAPVRRPVRDRRRRALHDRHREAGGGVRLRHPVLPRPRVLDDRAGPDAPHDQRSLRLLHRRPRGDRPARERARPPPRRGEPPPRRARRGCDARVCRRLRRARAPRHPPSRLRHDDGWPRAEFAWRVRPGLPALPRGDRRPHRPLRGREGGPRDPRRGPRRRHGRLRRRPARRAPSTAPSRWKNSDEGDDPTAPPCSRPGSRRARRPASSRPSACSSAGRSRRRRGGSPRSSAPRRARSRSTTRAPSTTWWRRGWKPRSGPRDSGRRRLAAPRAPAPQGAGCPSPRAAEIPALPSGQPARLLRERRPLRRGLPHPRSRGFRGARRGRTRRASSCGRTLESHADFFRGAELVVRINPLSGPWGAADLAELALVLPQAILLPKCEGPAEVQELDRELDRLEAAAGGARGRTRILPILESARGVLAAAAIASASDRLAALCFGAEDFTADIGVRRTAAGTESLVARQSVVLAAKAAGIQALDSVFSDTGDQEGFAAYCAASRAMGFDGVGVIHPRQIAVANRAFSPTARGDRGSQGRRGRPRGGRSGGLRGRFPGRGR